MKRKKKVGKGDPQEILGMTIASANYDESEGKYKIDNSAVGKWHGREQIGLMEVKFRGWVRLNFMTGAKKNRSKLLGCVFHAIEDWYAHSYYSELKRFLNTVKNGKYKIDKPDCNIELEYHSDRIDQEQYIENDVVQLYVDNETGKSVNKEEHKENKDNPKRDFNKKTGGWKQCEFSNNKRIKGAINECVKYLKAVK